MNKEDKELEKEIDKELAKEEEMSIWKQIGLFIYETVRLIVIVFLAVLIIRTFIVQPFFVVGDSMKPNLLNGDYLLVDEISYRFRAPARGDIIVFRFPQNPAENYIKRIVALPGERIEIAEGKVKIFNSKHPEGIELEEDYLVEGTSTEGSVNKQLGSDEYFVMGDNRRSSSDSRSWGILPRKNIIGRTFVVIFPWEDFKIVNSPEFKTLNQ